MTGNILRHLREGYGLTREQVAVASGVPVLAIAKRELKGKSWCRAKRPCERRNLGKRRQAYFRAYLTALRIMRPIRKPAVEERELVLRRAFKSPVVKPEGATHQVERQGIKEWVRIVPMHGTLRGFAWRGDEWRRAAWVEGSNEFQAALLAARLPLKKRKTVPVQGAINIYHDTLRERGWR